MANKKIVFLYESPLVRAAVAFAVVTLGASWLVGGCTPAYIEGDRLVFSGTDLEGQPVSLAGERFRGKVVLVEIWGVWCPPCVAAVPMLAALQRRYGAEGFEVIGVEFASSYSGTREEYIAELRGWVEERGINYTVVQAGEVGDVEKVFPTLKSFQGYPTTILIGRDGRVRQVETGSYAGAAQQYEKTIETLLRESAPQQ